MTIKITIIGTGLVGASIGLALAGRPEQFMRTGHDKEPQASNRAKKMGALDRVDYNLPSSIEDAAIIILSLPQDQIRETLQFIASDLKEDAVIMDTAPLKGEVGQWMAELLPPGRHYIGLTPVFNPAYLETSFSGVDAARADLFRNGLMAIYLPRDLPEEAVKLAIDFCQLLGAEHMFIDPLELDGMQAAIHLLPQLVAAALLNATIERSGWRDARKLTGRPFALSTGAVPPAALASSFSSQVMASRENLLRDLDVLLDNLAALRSLLDSQAGEQLNAYLNKARQAREGWQQEKAAANWAAKEMSSPVAMPTSRQVFSRMFTFGGGRKPKKPK
jgi:prephenate dehydrogenase